MRKSEFTHKFDQDTKSHHFELYDPDYTSPAYWNPTEDFKLVGEPAVLLRRYKHLLSHVSGYEDQWREIPFKDERPSKES